MAQREELCIGLDVGGTTVKEGLFTLDGELIAREVVPTPPLIDATGYAAVSAGIDRLLAEARASIDRVGGIGLAVPAPVPVDGDIKVTANIELDLPGLKSALERHCAGAAVKFENDANAAAMGELWMGAARGYRSFVFVTIGTGLGGGVVVDGDVVSGAVGAAGELGHMCLNPAETLPCGCGGHGCLEQYASATGITRSYVAACAARGREPVALDGASDSRSVFAAARAGDPAADDAIKTMCDYLGRAFALVACVIDPEAFVLGGGTSNSADMFLDRLDQSYRRYALVCSADTPIEIASLGNDAGVFGAAYAGLRAAVR